MHKTRTARGALILLPSAREPLLAVGHGGDDYADSLPGNFYSLLVAVKQQSFSSAFP